MKKTVFRTILISCMLFALTACDRFGGEAPDSPVLAKVDKAPITRNDFVREISRVPEWARTQFSGTEGKQKFLDELIKRELIYQHAMKMRLQKNEDYLAKLKEFEKMTLVSIVLKKEVEEKTFIDDSEVKEFFDNNADKFTIGSQLKASHILVEKEDTANKIHERIKKGESFAKLAKEFSKDTGSAEKGGDLGYFGRGKMVPEFEQAALRLKPGEVSKPVRTRFGFHIIKLTDIKKGKPADFEQAKESIKRQLLAERKKKLFDAYVEKLKGELTVATVEENLSAITLPWEQAEEPASESAEKANPTAK